MKIYLTLLTAGHGGDLLNGNLRHFARFIQDELNKTGFNSSFEIFWLTLAYPPEYIFPGVIEKSFGEYYDKLPYSRMSRQSKKIEISLQAPEFSAYFDNKDIDEYTVGKTYNCKDIEEPGLAKILIEKYLQAAELIAAKLKREDIFDLDKFKSTLLVIKENISLDFLKAVTTELTIKLNADTLSRAIELRENRKKINAPKDKLIRDFRVYGEGLPDKALYPYATQYAEIFLKLLRRNKLMCPKYNHLYIQVVPTFDEGLKNSFAYEDWNVNGIAVIDYTNYQKQSEKKKKETVFNLIVEGLKDIAYIDNLDMSIIDKVIAEIKNE